MFAIGVIAIKNYFLDYILPRFLELLTVPFRHTDVLWIIVPLVTTLLLMEFYFGRYSDEELGWNTAFGNSIVLLFVAIDLFRHIYGNPDHITLYNLGTVIAQTLVASLVGVQALWLIFFDYFHFLPKKVAFFISSSLPNNLVAYVAIGIVYTGIGFDIVTLLSALMLFIILYGFFRLLRLLTPKPTHKKAKVYKGS